MNARMRRCTLVASMIGLMIANPTPAFACERGDAASELGQALAAIRAVVASVLAPAPELPGGPPIPIPTPD